MPSKLQKVREELTHKKEEIGEIDYSKGLSSGASLVNLACTGRAGIAFLPGHYYRLIGSSQSGKTALMLSTMAEATINPLYDEYNLIYDGPEYGALTILRKFYGAKFADRVRPPSARGPSQTIEEYYYNLDDAISSGKPFIYGLDSMDAITSKSEITHFKKSKNAFLKGTKPPGTYGDGKAKKNSSGLRPIMPGLQSSGSILMVISQSRDNIEEFSFQKETASGGRALTFYATIQIWTSIVGSIKKQLPSKYGDRKLKVAQICRFHIDKTRLTGQDRSVDIPIYPSFGIDDTGSMIDWLVDYGHWSKNRGKIEATEFSAGEDLDRENLVNWIEAGEKERELRLIVAETWNEVEAAVSIQRKARYL